MKALKNITILCSLIGLTMGTGYLMARSTSSKKILIVYLSRTKNTKAVAEIIQKEESESAAFWMTVLTNLKARSAEDILIARTDNLKGLRMRSKGYSRIQ